MNSRKRWIECLLVLTVLLVMIVVFWDDRTTALDKLAAGEYSVLNDAEKEEADCEEVMRQTSTVQNAFFFPMISDTVYMDVACELNFVGAFEGTAKLKVSRVPDTKLDSYYELILTDLQGECSNCGDMRNADCYYDKDFPIGYMYVSAEEIYLLDYSENYLDIFKETECFPPTDEYIESLHKEMMEEGEHYGYFGYRLVCAKEGREDTCGEEERIGFVESALIDYHNYVAVEGDERQYVFGPNEERTEWGTNEYMSITWKENQGMIYYVNGVGAQRDHISFWVETEEDEAINAEDDENVESLPDETIWPYYAEEKVYVVEEEGVSIEIFYPALHGFEDKETEQKVNQLIAEDCLRLIPDEVNEEPSEGRVVCAYLDYEIKFMNYNMVSIYYEGLTGCTTPGSGLEASAMATTVNLETKEVVLLSDFITDFEELHSLLMADFFTHITPWDGSTGVSSVSWEYGGLLEEYLLAGLKDSDEEYDCIEWYTDGKNLVIVSVLNHYNEYAASIESLQYLMTEEFYGQLTEETDVSLVKFTEWYELYELDNWDRCIYVIKNADGEFVFSEMVYRCPIITLYDERYLEVRVGAGTGVWWCRYIDMRNETVSEDYQCAFHAEGGVVGWVDVKENGDRTLRLENVFSPDKYSWDIDVDFAPEEIMLVESSCLREILRIEDNKVEISYINSEGIETKGWFPVDGWIEPEVAQLDILVDDICTDAKLIEEHPVLSEFLRDDLEFEKEFGEEFGSVPATMEYFTFDFNDDGLEDYFTCYYGSAWCGTQGNSIRIYVQEEGELRSVLCVTARVHGEFAGGGHAPISILQTKTEEFFDIVLPTRESSAVWRYDAESGKYEFLYEIEE